MEWISVKDDMPKEEDSVFARCYGTTRWTKGMFRKISKKVLVTFEMEDGNRERRIGMKELKIYLEIIGLAEDENGNPDAAGLSIGGNMVPEDEYEEKMEEIRQKVTIKDVLWFTGLGMFV